MIKKRKSVRTAPKSDRSDESMMEEIIARANELSLRSERLEKENKMLVEHLRLSRLKAAGVERELIEGKCHAKYS